MNQRAKLRDLFVERYPGVAGEAREDFNAPSARPSSAAQVKRLRAEGRRR
jgi:hypothetical protein